MLEGFYDRFDPSKQYDRLLFRVGRALQVSETNELQSQFIHRITRLSDALFRDGALIRDARLIVNADTGHAVGEAGAIYLRGAVRDVPRREFDLPTVGAVTVGVYLDEQWITELEDPGLYDQAEGTRNYMMPGAGRLKVTVQWGYAGEVGQVGEFFPVYNVQDAAVLAKDPPPTIDGVVQAIARYDRESAGDSYVVAGLKVAMAADQGDGKQVYTVQEGTARIDGYPVDLPTSLRVVYDAQPDLGYVDSEPFTAAGGTERVTLNKTPVADITQVRITTEKTVTVTHGNYSGAKDALPDAAVLQLVEVKQGATTYVIGTDVKLTSGEVDWSLPGAEPAPGSTYTVKYRAIVTVTPTSPDSTGFTVSGAVVGTLVQTSYHYKRPRYDRLVLSRDGRTAWINGIPHDQRPSPPAIPPGVLLLATVYQAWGTARRIDMDGTKVVSMSDMNAMRRQIDDLYDLVARNELLTNAAISEPAAKRGVFVDPFLDDDQRDQGISQTAAIIGGEVSLGLTAHVESVTVTGGVSTLPLATDLATAISQPLRTSSMKVNPYMAFAPIPAVVGLQPAVDFWTQTLTQWSSPVTRLFDSTSSSQRSDSWNWRIVETSSSAVEQVSSKSTDLPMLRQIEIHFTVDGFAANEAVTTVKFDGLTVAATAA